MNVVKELKSGKITADEALEKIRLWKYRAPMYEFKEIFRQEEFAKRWLLEEHLEDYRENATESTEGIKEKE